MKKTKIVATIGPASEEKEILKQLFLEGVNICRLNFSHGNHEEHALKISRIKELREELNLPIGIMLDTKGPEIRLGAFEGEMEYKLFPGDRFTLTTKNILGNQEKATISYKNLPNDIKIGDMILIDDGILELQVIEITDTDILCEALNEGIVKSYKGVNIPGVKVQLPSLTKKDEEDIVFGIEHGIDFIAASFIRQGEDILKIRKILETNGNFDTKILAKIENQEGVNNMDEIIRLSDGIMVARGDLGVEIKTEEIPIVQKELIRKSLEYAKPVITATQMLDSMIRNPRPTRAEVTDVANAIFDGTSAIMLSGETASGKYPIEAVKTMSKIAIRTEKALDYESLLEKAESNISDSTTNAIGKSTCLIARDLNVKAIITATSSGFTTRAISKFKPKAPIIAATTSEKVRRQLALEWGVYPIEAPYSATTDSVITVSVEEAIKAGYVNEGDLVVLTAGVPVGVSGTTNLIKVHTIAKSLATGTGIGQEAVAGKSCIFSTEKELFEKFSDGDILIVSHLEKYIIPYAERASGMIVEEAGLTSDAAIMGISLGIPTIVGVENARVIITDGELVTIDPKTGQIFSGEVDSR